MTTYEVIPTTVEHVIELAETMRQEDRDEVWASAHFTAWDGLVSSIRYTDEPLTALADGVVLCIFGVGKRTLISRIGYPWMLSSNAVPQHLRTWARGSKVAFNYLTRNVDYMENYVDARYTSAVRWLKWLGFTVYPPEPFGKDQLDFHLFTWGRDNV